LQTPLSTQQSRLHESTKQIGFIQQRLLRPKQEQFTLLVSKLNTVSPLATLERGYTVVKDDSGKVAPSTTALKTGDRVEIMFRDGSLPAKILDN
jgi:exodeoxyribonuclease VII large subunit